jgi:hypothetical protein
MVLFLDEPNPYLNTNPNTSPKTNPNPNTNPNQYVEEIKNDMGMKNNKNDMTQRLEAQGVNALNISAFGTAGEDSKPYNRLNGTDRLRVNPNSNPRRPQSASATPYRGSGQKVGGGSGEKIGGGYREPSVLTAPNNQRLD